MALALLVLEHGWKAIRSNVIRRAVRRRDDLLVSSDHVVVHRDEWPDMRDEVGKDLRSGVATTWRKLVARDSAGEQIEVRVNVVQRDRHLGYVTDAVRPDVRRGTGANFVLEVHVQHLDRLLQRNVPLARGDLIRPDNAYQLPDVHWLLRRRADIVGHLHCAEESGATHDIKRSNVFGTEVGESILHVELRADASQDLWAAELLDAVRTRRNDD